MILSLCRYGHGVRHSEAMVMHGHGWEWLRKPGKYEKSKQGFQDICWKVHDRPQPFDLRSYTT